MERFKQYYRDNKYLIRQFIGTMCLSVFVLLVLILAWGAVS